MAAADGSFTETMAYNHLGQLDYAVSFEGIVTDYVYDTDDGLDPGDSGRLTAKYYFDSSAAHAAWLADPVTNSPAEAVFYRYEAISGDFRHPRRFQTPTNFLSFFPFALDASPLG